MKARLRIYTTVDIVFQTNVEGIFKYHSQCKSSIALLFLWFPVIINKIKRYLCIDLCKQRTKSQENRTVEGKLKNYKTKLIFYYSAEIGQNLLSFGLTLVISIFITTGRCNELKANFAAS